jgi:DNA polymerase-3 subunit alpha
MLGDDWQVTPSDTLMSQLAMLPESQKVTVRYRATVAN